MRERRREVVKARCWTWPLFNAVALGLCLLAGVVTVSEAQLPKPAPPQAEPASPVDPLRRETPRSAVEGLLRCDERGDFACAARYLQPPPDQQVDMLETAREFHALNTRYKVNIAGLSDDPNGRVEEGLPLGQERAGLIKIAGRTAEVILTRVDDPNYGKIWLVSGETVAQIPQLYVEF